MPSNNTLGEDTISLAEVSAIPALPDPAANEVTLTKWTSTKPGFSNEETVELRECLRRSFETDDYPYSSLGEILNWSTPGIKIYATISRQKFNLLDD